MKNNVFVLAKLMIVLCAIIFILLTFVLTPIYVSVSNDIITKVTVLPSIIYLLMDLFEICAFAVVFSIVIYAAFTLDAKASWKLFGIYVATSALRRALSLIASFISTRRIDSLDLISVFLYLLMDSAIAAIVTFIVTRDAEAYLDDLDKKKKASLKLGKKIYGNEATKNIFCADDPYCRSILKAGIVISAVKIITRIISDIFEGLPESIGEGLVMLAYYLSDVLICVVFYIIARLITFFLLEKNKEDISAR